MSKPYARMTQRERDGRNSVEWKRTRAAVFAIHGDVCWLCGRPGADTVDHVAPLSEGGTNAMSNLRPAHGPKQIWGCPGNFGRNGAHVREPHSREW